MKLGVRETSFYAPPLETDSKGSKQFFKSRFYYNTDMNGHGSK